MKYLIQLLLPTSIGTRLILFYQSDLGNKITHGAFWSLVGAIVSRGLMLVTSIITARILGTSVYGELGIIRSTIGVFAIFAGFGLGLTATKFIAENLGKDNIKVGRIIGLTTLFAVLTGVIISFTLIFGSTYIAQNTIDAPHLVNELRIGALILFFTSLNGAQSGILAGFEKFKTIAKVNVIAGILSFPLQITFTIFYGLQGALIGYGLNFVFLYLLNFYFVRKTSKENNIEISYRNSLSERKILWKFSLPALFSGILVSPVIWYCNTLLVNQEKGFAQMGIYDAAYQWMAIIMFIPAALSQITLPILSKSLQNKKEFNKVYKTNLLLNVSLTVIVSILVSVLSPYIMSLYGKDFDEGQNVLIVLSIAAIFISANNIIGKVIASRSKMWNGFILNIVWAVVLVVSASYFLAHGMGAIGLALAMLISYFTHTVTQSIYAKKTNKL